jgi:hydrogenase maturation protein HypF
MQAPRTSSLGRVFDAASAIAGVRLEQAYEGQAAMELEALVEAPRRLADGFRINDNVLDFRPLLIHLAEHRLTGSEAADVFHGTLITGLAAWAAAQAEATGLTQIALGGGCAMNRVLAGGLARALRDLGLEPFLPSRVPANDGGIALGQAAYARQIIRHNATEVEEISVCA